MYFLYSGETKRIPQGVKYFFYNAENGQSLIYAEEKKYKGFSKVENEAVLSANEKTWFAQSKVRVASEYIRENREAIEEHMQAFLDSFEEELKKEKEKHENGRKTE